MDLDDDSDAENQKTKCSDDEYVYTPLQDEPIDRNANDSPIQLPDPRHRSSMISDFHSCNTLESSSTVTESAYVTAHQVEDSISESRAHLITMDEEQLDYEDDILMNGSVVRNKPISEGDGELNSSESSESEEGECVSQSSASSSGESNYTEGEDGELVPKGTKRKSKKAKESEIEEGEVEDEEDNRIKLNKTNATKDIETPQEDSAATGAVWEEPEEDNPWLKAVRIAKERLRKAKELKEKAAADLMNKKMNQNLLDVEEIIPPQQRSIVDKPKEILAPTQITVAPIPIHKLPIVPKKNDMLLEYYLHCVEDQQNWRFLGCDLNEIADWEKREYDSQWLSQFRRLTIQQKKALSKGRQRKGSSSSASSKAPGGKNIVEKTRRGRGADRHSTSRSVTPSSRSSSSSGGSSSSSSMRSSSASSSSASSSISSVGLNKWGPARDNRRPVKEAPKNIPPNSFGRGRVDNSRALPSAFLPPNRRVSSSSSDRSSFRSDASSTSRRRMKHRRGGRPSPVYSPSGRRAAPVNRSPVMTKSTFEDKQMPKQPVLKGTTEANKSLENSLPSANVDPNLEARLTQWRAQPTSSGGVDEQWRDPWERRRGGRIPTNKSPSNASPSMEVRNRSSSSSSRSASSSSGSSSGSSSSNSSTSSKSATVQSLTRANRQGAAGSKASDSSDSAMSENSSDSDSNSSKSSTAKKRNTSPTFASSYGVRREAADSMSHSPRSRLKMVSAPDEQVVSSSTYSNTVHKEDTVRGKPPRQEIKMHFQNKQRKIGQSALGGNDEMEEAPSRETLPISMSISKPTPNTLGSSIPGSQNATAVPERPSSSSKERKHASSHKRDKQKMEDPRVAGLKMSSIRRTVGLNDDSNPSKKGNSSKLEEKQRNTHKRRDDGNDPDRHGHSEKKSQIPQYRATHQRNENKSFGGEFGNGRKGQQQYPSGSNFRQNDNFGSSGDAFHPYKSGPNRRGGASMRDNYRADDRHDGRFQGSNARDQHSSGNRNFGSFHNTHQSRGGGPPGKMQDDRRADMHRTPRADIRPGGSGGGNLPRPIPDDRRRRPDGKSAEMMYFRPPANDWRDHSNTESGKSQKYKEVPSNAGAGDSNANRARHGGDAFSNTRGIPVSASASVKPRPREEAPMDAASKSANRKRQRDSGGKKDNTTAVPPDSGEEALRRRNELLQQLAMVEDAIAKKRAKLTGNPMIQ